MLLLCYFVAVNCHWLCFLATIEFDCRSANSSIWRSTTSCLHELILVFTFYRNHNSLKQATFRIFLPCDLYLVRLLVSSMFLSPCFYQCWADIWKIWMSWLVSPRILLVKILWISKIVVFEMILSLDFEIMRSGHRVLGGGQKYLKIWYSSRISDPCLDMDMSMGDLVFGV